MGKELQEKQQNVSCGCVRIVVLVTKVFFLFLYLYFLTFKGTFDECRPSELKNTLLGH